MNFFSETPNNAGKDGIITLILVRLRENGQHNKIKLY